MAIPSNEHIRRPLLESLADGAEHKLADTVQDVAQRCGLTSADLEELTPAGKHGLFYDHLCWTRWYLSKAELLTISRRGFTKITPRGLAALQDAPELISQEYLMRFPEYAAYRESVRRGETVDSDPADLAEGTNQLPPPVDPHVWIEKKRVANADDIDAPHQLGQTLWSPQRSKDGADIYRFMRDVAIGDIILHLTENQGFTGISKAVSTAEELTAGDPSSPSPESSYRIRLTGFTALDPPLNRETFFGPLFRDRLTALLSAGQKNLFYNSAPALNQGAYLTPAPPALIRILNDAYQSIAGRPLLSNGEEASAPTIFLEVKDDAASFESLVQRTYWTEVALSAIIESIRHPVRPSRQTILAGPPGTSKTFVAQELVRHLTRGDEKRARVVQFHPSYSYEQFIEGLRPTIVHGAVQFAAVPGIVLEMAEKCRVSGEDHFLIIDELNRANLSRVLGELMYLFEYRDRKIDLPYTRDFSLPPNLYFIATMNTADRNIRNIDIALRRRFDVFECPADAEVLRRFYSGLENRSDVPDLIDGFIRLNADLTQHLDEHHTIGHAFFMARHFTSDDLEAVWRRKICRYSMSTFLPRRSWHVRLFLPSFGLVWRRESHHPPY